MQHELKQNSFVWVFLFLAKALYRKNNIFCCCWLCNLKIYWHRGNLTNFLFVSLPFCCCCWYAGVALIEGITLNKKGESSMVYFPFFRTNAKTSSSFPIMLPSVWRDGSLLSSHKLLSEDIQATSKAGHIYICL